MHTPHDNLTRPTVFFRSIVVPLFVLLAASVPLRASETPAAGVELDAIGAGELLWRSERGLVPLPVVEVDAELSVTGPMIRGRLTQRFRNPTERVIDVLYAFPLPDRAAVHHMEMRIGDRRIVAAVEEREEARRTFAAARASGRKAALVQQHRPNLFTSDAANVNPGEEIEIVLEYLEELAYRAGRFELRLPLAFVPRYTPPANDAPDAANLPAARERTTGEARARRATPWATVRVTLRPGFEPRRIVSDSHSIATRPIEGGFAVAPSTGRIVGDRDFVLGWEPAAGEQPHAAAFVEEHGDERFALIVLLPPSAESDVGLGLPTETLFVTDVSGSMAGPSIAQARAALLAALERLRPEDRFNLLEFNDRHASFRPEFQQADAASLDAARTWVRGLRAGGGTMIYPALMRALELMGESRATHAQRIVFLTDGAVSNEQELFRALVERLGEVRLHTIGIGSAPNTYLMRKMAALGHGLCTFVSASAQAENRIAEFLARLDRPVVEDLRLDPAPGGLAEIYPASLPDLYAAEPLILSARLDTATAGGPLRVGGYTRAGWWSVDVPIPAPSPAGSGIAVRWARAKVEALMDSLNEGADAFDVREEVVELGLAFRLVTRYTSLVAVEQEPSALGEAEAVRLAATALPAGGTDRPLRLWIAAVLLAVGLALLIPLGLRGTP